MSAKEDIAAFHQMLDELGKKCVADEAYRTEMIASGINDLSDIGASTVVLAELLVRQGADSAEVAGFDFGDFDPMSDGIVIRTKKGTVRCLTHGTQSGKSCGGRTVVLTGGGAGTKHILEG
jgi:hypothetical protein